MINTKKLQQLFLKSQIHLKRYLLEYQKEYWKNDYRLGPSQIQIGSTPRLLKNYSGSDCRHYNLIFAKYNIVPQHCFDCYKIVIEPRNVVELFRLMIIFDELDLPNDNSRKCMVEFRPEVSGYYKGLIYSYDLQETQKIFNRIKIVISEEISTYIPVSLKRGCERYTPLYPDFGKIDEDFKPVMEYPIEWKKLEDHAKKNNIGAHIDPISFDKYTDRWNSIEELNTHNALSMLYWIKYSATIGDLSYLKLTNKTAPKFHNLKRPPYQNSEEEK